MTQKAFPPGMGWIPVVLAVGLAAVVSIGAFAPQWGTHVVGTQLQSNSLGGSNGGGAGDTGSQSSDQGGQGEGAGGSQPGAQAANTGKAGPGSTTAIDCAHGKNGGPTAPGVTASEIRIATTAVTTGVGAGFLGEATQGMQAAINQANNAGGICGRRIVLQPPQNDGWVRATGQSYIENYINAGNVFALVGEPDSEGLAGAIESGDIDRAQMPVVGTDGMLSDQYQDPWVWPVAASTVTNMHIMVKYALDQGWAHQASDFAIVYDTFYKFGVEGAKAFAEEVKRLTHDDIPGYPSSGGCQKQFCGISSSQADFTTDKNTFDNSCQSGSCKVVVLLLEPGPALTWMKDEGAANGWYVHLLGGEPLFDSNFGSQCKGACANLMVWTGYHPDIQPFDAEGAVATYHQTLKAVCPSCDTRNEFTEGAYLGTLLFLEAVRRVGNAGLPLTRQNLKTVLDQQHLDLGLAGTLAFGTDLPRIANASMVGYSDNSGASFNGWNYDQTGFVPDPARGQDFSPRTW